jgi:uncharacterized protein (TIGR03643 family)
MYKNYTKPQTETDRIIRAAWEDRVSFEAIEREFGLKEKNVIALMKKTMKPKMFNHWRMRVQGRDTKYEKRTAILEEFEKEALSEIGQLSTP